MDRVSAANYQTISGRRTWLDKNPGAGVPFGTTWSSIWAAGVQESIIAPIEAVGLVPADSVLGSPDIQLLSAIQTIAAAQKNATVTATPGAPLTLANAGLIPVDATAGSIILTLPQVSVAANGQPLRLRFIRLDATVNTVTIALHAGDTWLPGGGSGPLPLGPNQVLPIESDGVSRWIVTASSAPAGQCRLSAVSTSNLVLLPFGGNILQVGGVAVAIPAAGVSISNAGLVASTLYYTYAYLAAGVVTLELSATAPVVSPADGTMVKTGDASRALVGMVYTGVGAPGTFVDTPASRTVASWFNRRCRALVGASTAGASTGSFSNVELNTAARVAVLAWGDEDCDLRVIGSGVNSLSGGGFQGFVGIDGVWSGNSAAGYSATGGQGCGTHGITSITLGVGQHTISPFGSISIGGTGQFNLNINCIVRL